jgi:hypothetical protein
MNSVGMAVVTGGQTPVSISFGVMSYVLPIINGGILVRKAISGMKI